MSSTIKAAGGVVWRGSLRAPEIAVIHRPHRGDWSLPKGKLHQREQALAAAYREVVEETGLDVAVQHQLGTVRYRVDGCPKIVSYWSMRHIGGEFVANEEADKLVWLDLRDAIDQLTFQADHRVLRRFAARPVPDTTVLLVRHAKAGKRSAWNKDDAIRPIDSYGRRQAEALASFGPLFAPQQICAATPLRCRQTVQPLATRVGLPIEAAPAFSDKDFERHPAASLRALRTIARRRSVVVVSSQGDTIPGLLDALSPSDAPHDSRKGSVWALFFKRGELVQSDYYGRPA